jgi:hypothetical protein
VSAGQRNEPVLRRFPVKPQLVPQADRFDRSYCVGCFCPLGSSALLNTWA